MFSGLLRNAPLVRPLGCRWGQAKKVKPLFKIERTVGHLLKEILHLFVDVGLFVFLPLPGVLTNQWTI